MCLGFLGKDVAPPLINKLEIKTRPDKNAVKSGKKRGRPKGVREFPLLPIHNLKDDHTSEKMQLEIGTSAVELRCSK